MAERVLTLRLNVENNQANAAIGQFNNSLNQIATNQQRVQSSIAQLNQGFNQFTATLNTAVLGISAMKILEFAGDLNQLGQSVNIARQTFTALAGGTREAAEMLELLRSKTNGVVDNLSLMQGASRLLQMGLADSKEEVAGLTEMAIKLGGALGMNANKAVEDFSLLLANMSFLRLDQFGISAGAVRDRVRELAKEFPDMSREARFAKAVLEEGQDAMENLGTALDASGTALRRFETNVRNAMQSAGANINFAVEQGLLLVEAIGSFSGDAVSQSVSDLNNAVGYRGTSFNDQYSWAIQQLTGLNMGGLGDALSYPGQAIQTGMGAARGQAVSSVVGGGVEGFLDVLHRGFDAVEQIGDELPDALKEAERATEENTRALMEQSRAISDQIAAMMGWTPPEQRELEGAQASVRDALTRAGLSESEMDAAMRAGEQLLPRYLEQGMSPAEAAMRAYGIQDLTPGVGRDARYVGADTMDLLNVGNLPGFMSPDMSNYVGPMMLGGRIAPDFAWPTMRGTPGAMPTPNELDLGPFQDARYMRGGFEQAALQGSMLGYDAQMMTQTLAQAVAQGLQMAGVARGISDTMGGLPQIGDPLAIGMANYGQSQFNYPGYVQPNIPEPLVNQSLGGAWYQTMMGFMSEQSPASFGGMSYEDMPEYTTAVEEMAAAYDESAQHTQAMSENMDRVKGVVDTVLEHFQTFAQDLDKLKKGQNDIPIRLILDQHHFFIQVSNALSLFRVPGPGSGPQ